MYRNNRAPLQPKELADCIRIWSSANLSLVDIRHHLISPKEPIRHYCLPANAVLYTGGAKAEVLLDDTSYAVERFGIFHAGKGTELSVHPAAGWLEYYMVLYKAGAPTLGKQEFLRLMERINPFRQQYGFSPQSPLLFMEQLRKMYERWKGPTPLNLFYGKVTFYQLIYQIYENLERGNIHVFESDVITLACKYMDQHYGHETSIQELCGALGVSYSSFYRSFKQKVGMTPQEYLIKTRLEVAKKCLETSNVSIREVAEHCGFSDEHNLYRQFAKCMGMSPNVYRQNSHSTLKDHALGSTILFPYNWERQVSGDEPKDKGVASMLKQMRNKAAVAAALSLMLLLSACGTAPVKPQQDQTAPSAAVMTEAQQSQGEAMEETRIINTPSGEVEVPVNPKRVIALYTSIGDMLALGVQPIAAVKYNIEHPNYYEQMQGVSLLADFSAESLMAYEPDLLLLTPDVDVEKLSKLAPVVVVPYTEMTMEERVALVGEALGRQKEASQALFEYHQKVEEAKKQLLQAGVLDRTISIFEPANTGYWVYGNKWGFGGGILYDQLGFKAPALVEENIIDDEQWREISLEVLHDYAGDYILFLGDMTSLEGNPIWESLPAVMENRVIHFDSMLFFGQRYFLFVSSAGFADAGIIGKIDFLKR